MVYRLAKGILSKPQLQAGNAVSDFPRQVDQPDLIDWIPLGDRDMYIPYSDLFESFDGGLYEDGNGQFTWELWCSPLMLKYLMDHFTEDGRRDALVTVETENKPSGGGGWIVVTARLRLRDTKRDLQRQGSTLFVVQADFIEAADAADGCDLTVAISDGASPTWQVSTAQTVEYTVNNGGDFSTSTDVVLVVPIPAKLDLDTVVDGDWSTEYDTGSGYSLTVPGDLSTVTSLRFTRSTALLAGEDADLITLTFSPDASGAESITASVSTDFEANTGNNDATLAITIDP